MIQSQFDAASKLGGSASHQSSRESDEHASAQQPRKRRKTSPPVEDSIEVAAESSTEGAVFPVEGDSNVAVNPTAGGTRSLQSSSINNANQAELEEVEAKTEDQGEDARMNDSAKQEIVSKDKAGLPDDAPVPERSRSTGAVSDVSDAPNSIPPNSLPHSDNPPGHGPPQSALTAPKTIETQPASQWLPGQNSATPGALLMAQDGPQMTNSSHPSHTSKPLHLQQSRTIQHPPCRTSAPSTGPSTPRQVSNHNPQIKSSSPLSSPPTELFDPFDEQLAQPAPSSSRPSSPVSEDVECNRERVEEGEDESDQSLSQEHFNRSSTFRRSLSTLKGRELFDAAIWADPLKTSVFYTFATNLRQKSRDASPTGCHHFISHLSKAGKMVRCYTQNIDLLEDKVGLSTRLLLGPGSRSRFSTRTSAKNAAGSANPRNPGDHNHQPAVVSTVSGLTVPGDICQRAMEDRAASRGACDTNSQAASTSLVEEVDISRPRASVGDHGVAEAVNDLRQRQEEGRPHGERCEQDGATAHVQPVDMGPSNPDKSVARTDPGPPTPERDRGVECVFLHGSLRALRCFQCGCVANWDEGDRELQTMSGSQPPCPRCEDATVARQERGKRALGVGKLRPDIVLYGEEHPDSQQISTIIQHDISLAPDMLIVMGTSLKVHGLKTVVREFAKTVHNRKDGKVIFVNYTKPAESVWADTFDFWVEMDCDAWIDDLKDKKPIIWLPPGSIEEEPRSTKRRRLGKDEAEKKDSKKTKKLEGGGDVKADASVPAPVPAKASGKRPKKVEKDASTEANRPAPKRPAAFRDCKQNAAYWTTKVWSDLAAMSGRAVTLPTPPSPAKAVLAVQNAAPSSAGSGPLVQGTVKPAEPTKTRRGPRTKNAKSRRAILAASEVSDLTEEQSKTLGATPKPAKEQARRQAKSTRPKIQNSSALNLSTPVTGGEGAQLGALDTKQEALNSFVPPDDLVLAEVPVPNTALNLYGEDNSILAAVKSHHRIRKPKAIFGETPPSSDASSRFTTPGFTANSKSKARATSQPKKAKDSVKVEENEQVQGIQCNQASSGAGKSHVPVLPKPSPRARAEEPQATMHTSQPPQILDESFTLAPIQPVEPNLRTANLNRRDSFLQLALGTSSAAAPNATTPPAYLEPTVSPAPEDITPIMSPNHWRNRAFTFGDPLSGYIEPPRRPLDYTELNHNSRPDPRPGAPAHAYDSFQHRPLSGRGQPPALVDSPHLHTTNAIVPDLSPANPNSPVAGDSPSRQLQRETDAATALSQMSQWTVYDNRQFARI